MAVATAAPATAVFMRVPLAASMLMTPFVLVMGVLGPMLMRVLMIMAAAAAITAVAVAAFGVAAGGGVADLDGGVLDADAAHIHL